MSGRREALARGLEVLPGQPLRRRRAAEAVREGAAADGLQARAVRLRRGHQPLSAAARSLPAVAVTLETVVAGVLRDWVKPDGSFRSRQLFLGWDNVPMHRWAQSQMFRSLAFYWRESLAA